ncbi:MAG: ORF6N domain-containing protein [Ruminococcus sp.]|nr:ORF6N domain-containing protein [Ruminococcus sp.]
MEKFNLTPIENERKKVLTTAQLAEAYGTYSRIISNNFNRNKERYIEGVHFYRLTGDDL